MRYSVKRVLTIDRSEVCCIICKRICLGEKSFKSHYTQMHINISTEGKKKRGKPVGLSAWNKGLTKETDNRIMRQSENNSKTIKQQLQNGTYIPRIMGVDARKELSERQSLRNTGGRCKWFIVNDVAVQGTWERDIALKLNELGIKWIKSKTKDFIIKYIKNGKEHSYTPDFYLPQYNVYLEIKGYWWGDDKEKMRCVITQNPDKNIIIIEKNQYEDLLNGKICW